MSVLRGQVAVIRPDGSAVQPAPSGTLVNVGDEIRTLSATGALITFFVGTEIELGPETILVVDQISQQGTRIAISLKQALGATLSRIETFTDPGSAYRIEAGGIAAVVRGSTLAVRGPETTPNGTFVSMVCLDCGPNSYLEDLFTGERRPLGPEPRAYAWPVDPKQGPTGRRTGGFEDLKVDRAAGPENTAAEGITTAAQREQGDTRGVPAGQVPGGRQEIRAELDREVDNQDQPEQAASLPPSNLRCQAVAAGGSTCTFTVTTGPGTVAVTSVRLIIETTAGFEERICDPSTACSFGLTGLIFQGSRITRIFTLASGETRTTQSSANCGRPAGTPC